MKKKIVTALLITVMTASVFAGCGNRMEGDGKVQAMADAESSQNGNDDSRESGAEGTGAVDSETEETAEPTEEPEPASEGISEPTAEPETGSEASSGGNADESGSVTQTGQSGSAVQTDEADEANQAGTAIGEETADSPYTIDEAVTGTMYAKSAVNVRNQPSTDGEKVGRLAYGQEVAVTGQCKETGWYQIDLNGEKAFVSNGYIVSEKPAATTQTAGNTGNQGSGSGQTAN